MMMMMRSSATAAAKKEEAATTAMAPTFVDCLLVLLSRAVIVCDQQFQRCEHARMDHHPAASAIEVAAAVVVVEIAGFVALAVLPLELLLLQQLLLALAKSKGRGRDATNTAKTMLCTEKNNICWSGQHTRNGGTNSGSNRNW